MSSAYHNSVSSHLYDDIAVPIGLESFDIEENNEKVKDKLHKRMSHQYEKLIGLANVKSRRICVFGVIVALVATFSITVAIIFSIFYAKPTYCDQESWVILCEPLAQRLITHAFLSCPGDDKITVKKIETFTKDDYKYNTLYCKKTSSCTKLRSNGTQMISSICNGNSFCSIKQNIYSDIILHDSSCLFSKVHKKSYNWLKVYYTCT